MSRAHSLPALSPELPTLLASHGLGGVREEPLEHTGFSGATLTRLRRDDRRTFVLKRMSIERDWIMRATDDAACRETVFAAADIVLAEGVTTPTLGSARDGDGYALLMEDITPILLPQGAISSTTLDAIIDGMARLHASSPPPGVPWCALQRRLMLLTPATARIAASYGAPVARDIEAGWRAFDAHASPRAVALIRSLFDDPQPLLRVLDTLPLAFLHGDLKFDNIGVGEGGRTWLLDWAMTLVAPPAVELGWFLAINSRRLPVPLEDVMSRYADAAALTSSIRAHHDALTAICGLLLRGWRKALDAAAGEPQELRWWCDRIEAAAPFISPR